MKILYITQLYPPMLYGGGEYIFSKWAEEMAVRGHQVTVITQKICGVPHSETLNGVKIYRIPPGIQYTNALYSISLLENLKFLIHAIAFGIKIGKDIDLIHSNTFVPTIASEAVGKICNKPHVATIHDVYLQSDKKFWKDWSQQEEVGFLSKIAGSVVEKLILKLRPKRTHTVSLTSKQDLIKAGIKQKAISVIPNGINLNEYRISTEKNPFQISYIGRLVFYKNLDTVIKAFRKVVAELPQAKFIIAGKGPYEKALKKLTCNFQLEDNIKFVGRISHDEKIKLLAGSQLMVQPSLVEGFGITVIESFACGTPVLASNVMPLPELVKDGENGATIDPFDESKWTETLLSYLLDVEKCKNKGKLGQNLVLQKYTIEKIVDDFEELYSEVLRNCN